MVVRDDRVPSGRECVCARAHSAGGLRLGDVTAHGGEGVPRGAHALQQLVRTVRLHVYQRFRVTSGVLKMLDMGRQQ